MTLIITQLALNFDNSNRVVNFQLLIIDQYQNISKTGNNEARQNCGDL